MRACRVCLHTTLIWGSVRGLSSSAGGGESHQYMINIPDGGITSQVDISYIHLVNIGLQGT